MSVLITLSIEGFALESARVARAF